MRRRPLLKGEVDDDVDMPDSVSQACDDDEPPMKRSKVANDKVGIGFVGVDFHRAKELIPADMIMKVCKFCNVCIASRDECNQAFTISWGKPGFGGKVCGLCMNAKNRLHPTLTVKLCLELLSGDQDCCAIKTGWGQGSGGSQISARPPGLVCFGCRLPYGRMVLWVFWYLFQA